MIIDISEHQGKINCSKLKSVVEGVIIRAAYGTREDLQFEVNCKGFRDNGIPIGAYQFATWHYADKSADVNAARSNAIIQANCFVNFLKDKGVTGYVALDLELEPSKSTNLSKQDMTDIANTYMDIIIGAGYRPVLYCSVSWIFDHMVPGQIKYPLWVAYYNDAGNQSSDFPADNYGNLMRTLKDKIVLWQYSSKGTGADYGVQSQFIDMNHLYGSFAPIINCPNSENPYPKPTIVPGQSLKKGAQGDGVKWLQWELNQHGYNLQIDGDFGDLTEAAVKDFQTKNGLTSDGIYGVKSDALLLHNANPYPYPQRSLKLGCSGDDVKWLQFELNCEGIHIAIDGKYGPLTESGVKYFQQGNGLVSDGIAGNLTNTRLKDKPNA